MKKVTKKDTSILKDVIDLRDSPVIVQSNGVIRCRKYIAKISQLKKKLT